MNRYGNPPNIPAGAIGAGAMAQPRPGVVYYPGYEYQTFTTPFGKAPACCPEADQQVRISAQEYARLASRQGNPMWPWLVGGAAIVGGVAVWRCRPRVVIQDSFEVKTATDVATVSGQVRYLGCFQEQPWVMSVSENVGGFSFSKRFGSRQEAQQALVDAMATLRRRLGIEGAAGVPPPAMLSAEALELARQLLEQQNTTTIATINPAKPRSRWRNPTLLQSVFGFPIERHVSKIQQPQPLPPLLEKRNSLRSLLTDGRHY